MTPAEPQSGPHSDTHPHSRPHLLYRHWPKRSPSLRARFASSVVSHAEQEVEWQPAPFHPPPDLRQTQQFSSKEEPCLVRSWSSRGRSFTTLPPTPEEQQVETSDEYSCTETSEEYAESTEASDQFSLELAAANQAALGQLRDPLVRDLAETRAALRVSGCSEASELDSTRFLDEDHFQPSSKPLISQEEADAVPFVGPPPVSHYRASRNKHRSTKMPSQRNREHAEESAEVEILQARAKRHQDLGIKIAASLNRIEEHSTTLEELIAPVYNDTQDFQTIIKNCQNISIAIERMRTPLDGKADEEKVIRDGPRNVGVEQYLASLRRVQGKFNQLNSTPMRVNQDTARELGQLIGYGSKKLQEMFDSIIKEDSRPVEPLSYTTKDVPFPKLPAGKIAQLTDLNAFIASTKQRSTATTPAIQVYADVRGNYLAASLQNMSTASLSIARAKKADEIYRLGQNTIGDYAKGIEGIFISEWSNVTGIFNPDECGITFELVTSKALGDFAKTIREINQMIQNNLTTTCFLGYEIIDITTKLAMQMDSATGQLKQQIIDAAKPVRETSKNSLSELLEDVRRRISGMIMLPQDGAAIGYTTEVMKRLQSLTDYRQPLASIMTSLGDGNWASPGTSVAKSSRSLDVSPDKDMMLEHYVIDTLEALFSNLEEKARQLYKSKSLLGIFLANNVAVADRMIRSSDLQPILQIAAVASSSPSKIEAWRKKGIFAYLESWREPCGALMDVQYTNRGPRPQSGSAVDSASIVKALSSKDKDAIKEKFKTFNVLFDSLTAKHREMLPNMERDVRSQTSREIGALVEPLYGRFWDRYHEVDKGKGKYVKFDKATLAQQMASLA